MISADYSSFHIIEYPSVRVVAVIEPDSLANLVTNLDVAACAAAESVYKVIVLLSAYVNSIQAFYHISRRLPTLFNN